MTRHCEHVKANGQFCGSPAMRGRNYCFFHLNYLGQRLRVERYASLGLGCPPLELPLLEDAASIQLALMQVTEALLRGTLDAKRGGLVLYALQTASSNLRHMAKEAAEEPSAAVCNRYDSLEEDYELGDCPHLRVDEAALEAAAQAERAAQASPTVSDTGGEAAEGSVNPPKQEISDIALTIDIGHVRGYLPPEASCQRKTGPGSEDGPIMVSDRDVEDARVRIPVVLTPAQYQQAKISMVEYEKENGIDRNHPEGRKPVPQRPAISQKILLGTRKPPASATGADSGNATRPAAAGE